MTFTDECTFTCMHLKPNSITLAGSKLVRSLSATSFEPASNQLA